MKKLLSTFVVCGALATPAAAASSQETYLHARDRYIGKLEKAEKSGVKIDELIAQTKRALDDLQSQMIAIIGPLNFAGAARKPTINLSSLTKGDIDFGKLDGLAYSFDGDRTQLVVTTQALLEDWLRAHEEWRDKGNANVPPDIAKALSFEDFYTQALSGDAAISKYADLPIAKPDDANALVSWLIMRRQDIGPWPPNEIVVAVSRAGKVFIVTSRLKNPTAKIPACDAVWKAYERKSKAAQDAYVASSLKDKSAFEDSTKIEERGDEAYRQCYGARLKDQKGYAAIVAQAQKLLDLLPAQ